MRIDFHTHILPHMDDGASDINESLRLLEMLSDSRVEKIVLTSHFYRSKESISAFIDRRKKALEELSRALVNIENCPELILGAEVYFYPSLASDPDFEKLCVENTDYILLELPFEQFHDNFYNSYANFLNKCEQKIVLAHIERYLNFGNTEKEIMRLFEYGSVLCQMNCASIAKADFFKRKPLLKFISDGVISALGTDTHNISRRPPLYDKAEKIITSKCGQRVFERISDRTEMILDNRSVNEVIRLR